MARPMQFVTDKLTAVIGEHSHECSYLTAFERCTVPAQRHWFDYGDLDRYIHRQLREKNFYMIGESEAQERYNAIIERIRDRWLYFYHFTFHHPPAEGERVPAAPHRYTYPDIPRAETPYTVDAHEAAVRLSKDGPLHHPIVDAATAFPTASFDNMDISTPPRSPDLNGRIALMPQTPHAPNAYFDVVVPRPPPTPAFNKMTALVPRSTLKQSTANSMSASILPRSGFMSTDPHVAQAANDKAFMVDESAASRMSASIPPRSVFVSTDPHVAHAADNKALLIEYVRPTSLAIAHLVANNGELSSIHEDRLIPFRFYVTADDIDIRATRMKIKEIQDCLPEKVPRIMEALWKNNDDVHGAMDWLIGSTMNSSIHSNAAVDLEAYYRDPRFRTLRPMTEAEKVEYEHDMAMKSMAGQQKADQPMSKQTAAACLKAKQQVTNKQKAKQQRHVNPPKTSKRYYDKWDWREYNDSVYGEDYMEKARLTTYNSPQKGRRSRPSAAQPSVSVALRASPTYNPYQKGKRSQPFAAQPSVSFGVPPLRSGASDLIRSTTAAVTAPAKPTLKTTAPKKTAPKSKTALQLPLGWIFSSLVTSLTGKQKEVVIDLTGDDDGDDASSDTQPTRQHARKGAAANPIIIGKKRKLDVVDLTDDYELEEGEILE